MKGIRILLFLLVIIIYACVQQTQKSNSKNVETIKYKHERKRLKIENGINRGLAFTDSLGDNYAITYISIHLTNIDSLPINFQFALSSEYNHPLAKNSETYTLVLLSKEWTIDGVTISDSLINEIPNDLKKGTLNTTLNPGEEFVFAIGSLRPSPAKICVVLPNELFINDQGDIYSDCDWHMKKRNTPNSIIEIGLKVDYCHHEVKSRGCLIIPCGKISYNS